MRRRYAATNKKKLVLIKSSNINYASTKGEAGVVCE